MIKNPRSIITVRKINQTVKIPKERKRKPFIDNYINDSISESINKTKNNSIRKLLDELHNDAQRFINNSEIESYKLISSGLIISLRNGIEVLVEDIDSNKKKYTIKKKKHILISGII